MLDQPERRLGGMSLIVLGRSAEGGDNGQVGSENRVNGVIGIIEFRQPARRRKMLWKGDNG